MDWRESPFSMNAFECTMPTMINKCHLPEDCFIPTKKTEEKQARTCDAWILGEEYVHDRRYDICSISIRSMVICSSSI